jgi:hypothetical protein
MWKRKREAEHVVRDDDDVEKRDIWDIDFIISLSFCLGFFLKIVVLFNVQSRGRLEDQVILLNWNYFKVWK